MSLQNYKSLISFLDLSLKTVEFLSTCESSSLNVNILSLLTYHLVLSQFPPRIKSSSSTALCLKHFQHRSTP